MIGLVHYPTTTAPVTGSVAVTTQCADNAHIYSPSNVTCTSNGSWSGQIPQCECDSNYYEAKVGGRQICLGKMTHLVCMQSSRIISFQLVHLFYARLPVWVLFTILLHKLQPVDQ